MLALLKLGLGAFLYRFRGGDFPWLSAPTGVKRALFALLLASGPLWELAGYWLVWPGAVLVLALLLVLGAFVTVGLGHGAYLDLGETDARWPERRNPKNVHIPPYDEEPEVAWLRRIFRAGTIADRRDLYELVAMSVSGLLLTLPAGLAYAAAERPWAGLALFAAGALKGPCYWVGHRLSPDDGGRAVRLAEWFTGAYLGGVAGALIEWGPA